MTKIRFMCAVVAVLIGVAALSGCGDVSITTNADLLKQAISNMKAANSYTMSADFSQAGQEFKVSGQFDIAGNSSDLEIDSGGQKASVITVSDNVYISTDGGATFARADDQGESITQSFSSFVGMWNSFPPDQIDKHKDELKDGNPVSEKLNGLDTKHITGNARDLSLASNSTETTTEGVVEFWVSTGTPYMLQMKINGTTGEQPVQGTYSWGNFNQKVDIKVPPTSMKLHPFAIAWRWLGRALY